MPFCRDPFLTQLSDAGYSVIRLPKTDMTPMKLLARDGAEMSRIGELRSVFVAGDAPLPAVTANQPAPNINGKKTSSLDIGLGLNILGNIIGAMGGNLGLDVAYKDAKTVEFAFTDVQEDKVDMADIDIFLGAATLNPHAVGTGQMLQADEVYVVTSSIKSRKISVTAKDENGTTLELKVPVVQEIVGGNLKVGVSGTSTGMVTYEGSVPLYFGFQAFQITYEDGKYAGLQQLRAGDTAARVLGATALRQYQALKPSGKLIDLG